jgi:hypothetical protein
MGFRQVDSVIDRCQGGAALLLHGNHAPEADGQGKEVVQQPRQHAITEMVVAMQNRDGSGGARAKGTGQHLRRTVGGDEVAATGTAALQPLRHRPARGQVQIAHGQL